MGVPSLHKAHKTTRSEFVPLATAACSSAMMAARTLTADSVAAHTRPAEPRTPRAMAAEERPCGVERTLVLVDAELPAFSLRDGARA